MHLPRRNQRHRRIRPSLRLIIRCLHEVSQTPATPCQRPILILVAVLVLLELDIDVLRPKDL